MDLMDCEQLILKVFFALNSMVLFCSMESCSRVILYSNSYAVNVKSGQSPKCFTQLLRTLN